MVAAIRQNPDMVTIQPRGAIAVDFYKFDEFGGTGWRENHRQSKPGGLMTHHRLTPTLLQAKPAPDGAVDADVEHLSPSLLLPKGHQGAVSRPAPITVNQNPRATVVLGEYLASAPGPINIRRDVVLKQPHGFHLMENGFSSAAVAKLKRVFEIQHLVKAQQSLSLQLLDQLPGLKQHTHPVGIDQPKKNPPQPGTDGTRAFCGDIFSLESNPLPVNKRSLSLLRCTRYRIQRWRYGLRRDWTATYRLLWLFNRRTELTRLIAWAKRKKLAGPRKCYERHLDDIEQKLLRYSLRHPGPAKWAFRLQQISSWLSPPPRYPRPGAASYYSSRYQEQPTRGACSPVQGQGVASSRG